MVIARPVTPVIDEGYAEGEHKPTPTKAKLRTLTKFCQDRGLDIYQKEINKYCQVPNRTAYRWLQSNQDVRRHHNSPYSQENRGRKHRFTDEDFQKVEDWLIEGGFEHRICPWVEIVNEVLPEKQAYNATIRAAFGQRGYHKCVTCQKPYLTPQSLRQRQEYLSLRYSWSLNEWRRVRFSDECHFGLGPQRKLKIIRRRGERYYPDCIQHNINPKKIKQKNEKR
jgi:hypothetical protein